MTLTFRIRYHTVPGQSLFLSGNHAVFGNGNPEHAVPLGYHNAEFWTVSIALPHDHGIDIPIGYNYFVRDADGELTWDWGADKTINPSAFDVEQVMIIDSWNCAGSYENALETEPFQQVLLKSLRVPTQVAATWNNSTHRFRARAPLLARGQTLCLLGGGDTLRNWDTTNPILLERLADDEFSFGVGLRLESCSFPIAYKYGVCESETRKFIRYEDGENRSLADDIKPDRITLVNDGFARLPSMLWRGAGVAIPVFSLRSETGFGVGEFTDLRRLVDWCSRVGLKLIQVLPVNDTTSSHDKRDSYPYSAISVFALHPIYMNLEQVAGEDHRQVLAKWEPERRRLNDLPALDYESVLLVKWQVLRELYTLRRDSDFQSAAYKSFFERKKRWLVPYAVFCCLRDRFKTAAFSTWPDHRQYSASELQLAEPGSDSYEEVAFHYFVQYHLHRQLGEASDYAHANGVVLKGDIAIGISRDGSDVWEEPEACRLETQAGAPPDDFAVTGQNWGFPTYDWDYMKRRGFEWWKRRFAQMGDYFDAFRIDHILGFFRIWTIPLEQVEGIMGHFVPAIPVRPNEFAARGIPFDRERFVTPHITDQVLRSVFPSDSSLVKERFLTPSSADRYSLKDEFATQRQVESHFDGLEPTDLNRRLKRGLFDLISNVILFETESPPDPEYHFRFAMPGSSSFVNLDAETQAGLKELYIDFFFRRQEVLWRREGLEKLPALKRGTRMLVCGEDLGLVPACVPTVMKELGILSLEVQRMPKEMNHEFASPLNAPYLSVVTPSTHDTSTVRGWWEEDRERTQRFYNNELGHPGTAPAACEPWINREIVLQHLNSPALWSVFPMQDLLGMDGSLRAPDPRAERINVPANPNHCWDYRMHLSLENLVRAQSFNDALLNLVRQSGR